MGLLDGILYGIEQRAASRSIPSIAKNHRIKWNDHDDSTTTTTKTFDHSIWTELLQQYVSVRTGTIDIVTDISTVHYDGMGNDARFDTYLRSLEACDPNVLSIPEQLAFWINAYNAFCIRLIVQAESSKKSLLHSINDLSTKDTKVWDMDAGTVHGKSISLNHIEHTELRRRFHEPRIHACIVCASASCPNLRNEAFVAEQLEYQMDDQMKDWMSNETKGIRWNEKERKLELSRIFLWFAEDFGTLKGVRTFVKPYVTDETIAKQLLTKTKIAYFAYSWKINRTPSE